MHRPAPALRHAVDSAVELGHDALRVSSTCDGVTVLAIVGEEIVRRVQGRDETDHGGLLTEVQVTVPPNECLGVAARRALLEAPNKQHLAIEVEKPLRGP